MARGVVEEWSNFPTFREWYPPFDFSVDISTTFDSRKDPVVWNSQRRDNSEQICCTRVKNGYSVYFFFAETSAMSASRRSVRELSAGRINLSCPKEPPERRPAAFAARRGPGGRSADK